MAYEGTRFAGWQLQAFRLKSRPVTVQGELERVFATMIGERIPVIGAGRTDAGVHAEAQVCHVDIPEAFAGVNWLRALNAQLPPDIRVLAVEPVPATFHARKSALVKEYAYSLWMHETRPLPRVQSFIWGVSQLDVQAMQVAAGYLTGQHDFASFQNSGTPGRNTVRTIFSITARAGTVGPLAVPADWPVLTWCVEGEGFLKQMVRNIMGLLVWVGQHKLSAEAIPHILAAKDRSSLPSPSAPAKGLTLLNIRY